MIGCENSHNISEYKIKKILAVSRSRIDPNKGTFDWGLIVTVLTVLNRCVSLSLWTQKAALKFHLLHINGFMHAVYNITANVVLELRVKLSIQNYSKWPACHVNRTAETLPPVTTGAEMSSSDGRQTLFFSHLLQWNIKFHGNKTVDPLGLTPHFFNPVRSKQVFRKKSPVGIVSIFVGGSKVPIS